MATVVGETYPYPLESAGRRRIELEMVTTVGASGAVTSSLTDDPGMTITRASTGTYNVTFPAAANNDLRGFIDPSVVSAGSLRSAYASAFVPNAGTATIVTLNAAGAATDGAAGDFIRIQLFLNSRKDF